MPAPAACSYVVDPLDPRAPPMEVWERMTPAERDQVVAMLPVALPTNLERALETERQAREAERQAREEAESARDEVEKKLAEALAEIARLRGTQ